MLRRVWKRKTRNEARSDSFPGQGRARQQDRGAAMVEMAFIFSILVMLLVGVVTSALAFGQKNSIENAAREASRYAATLAPNASGIDNAWLDQVRNVAQQAAQGNLDPGVDGRYICIAHLGSSTQSVLVDGTSTTYPDAPCYTDGLTDRRVQVVTGRDTQINAALFSIDITLEAPTTARYEREE